MSLHHFQSYTRQRISELYFRFHHARKIFAKRFFSLAVQGHVELSDNFLFDETKAINRGKAAPNGKYYSKHYPIEWDELPTEIKQLIKNYDTILKQFLGDDYRINGAQIWRNTAIPDKYKNTELFSQNWHYDKVMDYRNIQLFILLHEVTEKDGPFEYVTEPDEYNLIPEVAKRSEQNLNVGIKKLLGKRGDTFLFTTGSTPHRAGIPEKNRHRDIFSIAFFPEYTSIGEKSTELLAK
ncbi:hypothetical protein [Lentilitoribacter sp. EG35]|uniref:hypothetical protein n=1 Tax=Lentilitoribacter sp. EG35 TaxID=3234192 RepID=UPI0034614FDF